MEREGEENTLREAVTATNMWRDRGAELEQQLETAVAENAGLQNDVARLDRQVANQRQYISELLAANGRLEELLDRALEALAK